jgi:hypothetical protein
MVSVQKFHLKQAKFSSVDLSAPQTKLIGEQQCQKNAFIGGSGCLDQRR